MEQAQCIRNLFYAFVLFCFVFCFSKQKQKQCTQFVDHYDMIVHYESLRCDSYPETQGLFWSLKWELNYSLFVFQVSLSDNLYTFMHQLWLNHAPIGELF